MRTRSSIAAALVASATLAAGAAFVDGCGSIPCSDTDTCLAIDAGEPPIDHSVDDEMGNVDGSADAPSDALPDSTLRDANADANADADAGDATSDADADATTDAREDGEADADAGDAISDASDASDVANAVDACKDAEDCTNGIDDDCNGQIDCADTKCQPAFTCVPEWSSSGWTAPVVLYDDTVAGGPAPSAPSCVAPYGSEVFDGHNVPVAADAGCSCSCGTAQGTTCSAPYVVLYTSSGCIGAAYGGSLPNGTCATIESQQSGLNSAVVIDAGVPSGGSCPLTKTQTGSTWDPTKSAGWAETGRVCAAPERTYFTGAAGGCDAGLTCVAAPPGTFANQCLMASAHAVCPTAYPHTYRYFDGGADTRTCQFDCSCSAPTGVSCAPSVQVYSGAGCADAGISVGSCTNFVNLGSNNTVSGFATYATTQGQCKLDAGATQLTGAVTAQSGETTVCCTQ